MSVCLSKSKRAETSGPKGLAHARVYTHVWPNTTIQILGQLYKKSDQYVQ